MNILIIDPDLAAAQGLIEALKAKGHQVSALDDFSKAHKQLASTRFDLVLLDAGGRDLHETILGLRNEATNYISVILMSDTLSPQEAIAAGCNDFILKPVEPALITAKVNNAARLGELIRHIGDDSEDFPSAGGVISKSAFNQLFLSSIDRAGRYGEGTYALFIRILNYKEILQLDGAYAADYVAAKLSQTLVRLRRQSDIIGQTARHEYALLLLWPGMQNEPVAAAKRFAESLGEIDFSAFEGAGEIKIGINLIELPAGAEIAMHEVVATIGKKVQATG